MFQYLVCAPEALTAFSNLSIMDSASSPSSAMVIARGDSGLVNRASTDAPRPYFIGHHGNSVDLCISI